MRLLRRDSYADDLDRIAEHIAKDKPDAALAMWDEIESQVERLKAFPNSGRPGRLKGTRELVLPRTPFVVVYRVAKTHVELIRVLHGAQQWPKA
ncbi:type II toxin-antitoxin system RelE/ParE family toxin [Methylocystis heyeri]|uniref:Type II toxin-antitoxin system mRNA interferase toxin, RelE/StbE family n=1 Tax=Methylocystis heyeri TaxID=391905 RepID=A0A6B8KIX7_9HYPH|nr:type II toxin-antitoxin system RelE/ParE family toxin [Methylocystis heyeri]QGM48326.1 type II toxin-antitoxin system mRNA interferase toxin, RelE/StbE family [Methylocystis heyeri]